MSEVFISSLLIEEPLKWELRGDPFLWKDLRDTAHSILIPATSTELEILLKRLITDLLHEELTPSKNIYVQRYANGGISSGMISSDYWLNVLIPLIIKRIY